MRAFLLKQFKNSGFAIAFISSLALAYPAFAVDIDIADAATPDEMAVDQTIAVFISSQQASPVTVDYTISDGTAQAGLDYTNTVPSGTITFAPGETVKSINIPILQDDIDEDIETVVINLSNPSAGAVLVDSQAILSIVDDDPEPAISIYDNSTIESAGSYNLAATLNNPSSKQVSVSWRAFAGTAGDGQDFTAATGTLTFPAGSTSQNITLSLIDDSSDEDNETFFVSLYNPVYATLNNASATLTLLDDDPAPSISIADVTTTDENLADVQISLSAPSSRTVAFLATSNGLSADENTDYIGFSTTVMIPPGNAYVTLSVPLNNDTLDETDETFEVNLSNPSNATIFDNQAIVTITDDDAPPLVSISGATIIDDNGTLAPVVSLSAASSMLVEVDFATVDGTARAGADYTATSGRLAFVPGQTSQPLSIPISGDLTDEYDEIFSVTLSNPGNATLGTASATMLITDNDPAPDMSIADISTLNETAGPTNVMVSLNAASEKIITVDYATTDDTASSGTDYTATTGTLTFAAGVTSMAVPVSILSDTVDEANETVTVTLSNPSNANINDDTAILTITDDDASPSITIDDVTTASEQGIGQNVTLRLSAASERPVTVDYATADQTAWAGDDYIASSGTATFNPGDLTSFITVPILDDTLDEINETFEIQLTNPANATISDNSSIVTINDDDAKPSLSVSGAFAPDDNGTLTSNVVLNTASSLPVSVTYATQDGTATAGNDYVASTATLTFNPGQTSLPVSITILGDTIDEYDETFTLQLSNPDNATLGTAQATMLINDNDPAPALSIADATSASEATGPTGLTVSLSTASEKLITVNYTTANGTAVAGADYTAISGTLSFAPNVTSQTISVAILDDAIDEENETISVTLSNPAEATINDDTGVLTITDDDNVPGISIDDVSTNSEQSINQQVTLRLDAASERTISVDYATSDISALSGADYNSTSGTATFNPGDTSQTISVAILDDSIDEPDETFQIALSNPVNATITDNASVVTITDDEGMPALSVQDLTTADESATNITATIVLNAASSQTITVDYATADNNAAAGSDYVATSGSLSFAPGDLSKTVSIAILSDSTDENNETFALNILNPVNAVLNQAQGTITITDDDTAPTLSVADNITADETASPAHLAVSLSAASGKTITVNYTTSDGTAQSGIDYLAASGVLTFAPGIVVQNVPVTIITDGIDEDNETLTVSLSNPAEATLNDDTGVLTITDDDLMPNMTISDVTTNNESAVNQQVTVQLSSASGKTVSVDYQTVDGDARAGADYTAASGTLTFMPGSTSQVINVGILDDTLDEFDEGFSVRLSNATNAVITDNASVVTITDDEGMPSVSVQNAISINEAAANLSATISLNTASALSVSVNYTTSDDSALAGDDYQASSGTLTFAPGETVKTVDIPILSDAIDETDETFHLTLSGPSNATISTAQAVMTITDDDGPPALSIGDFTTADETSGPASMTVSLSTASGKSVTVDYSTANGTALSGSDYTALSGTLTFAPNVTVQTIPVTILHDSTDEDDETIIVTLSNPGAATISDGTGVLTIIDDDNPPAITIDDATTNNENAVNQAVTLHLSTASEKTITVDWTTQDGTAVATGDYGARSGTVTFNPGEVSQTILIPILDDTLDEPDETFTIALSNATHASISDNSAKITITDDEGLPTLSVQNVTTADENGPTVNVDIVLSASSALTVSVNYATADGSATAGNDYTASSGTLTFNPGVTRQTLAIAIARDAIDEADETFDIVLSAPVNAALPVASGTVTITDDDSAPALSISDNTTLDETAGPAQLTVSLSSLSERTITVGYTTSDGTAEAGSDYSAVSGTLTFAPNTASQTISVPVLSDAEDEIDETIVVNLAGATNASITDDTGVLTITDDDSIPAISIDDAISNNETAVNQDITLRLSAPSQKTINVDWATQDGTAVAGSDYSLRAGTVTFNPGDVTAIISVPILADNLVETDETFDIQLSNAINATISDANAVVTISDDDSLSLTVDDLTTADESATSYAITVTLSNPSSTLVNVDYATADSTAMDGSDYTGTTGTLSFNPGVTTQTFNVAILADTDQEGPETFEVNLSNPTGGASITDGLAVITITDDDGDPALSVADASISETSSSVTITVSLSFISTQPVSVDYATSDGSAIDGSDYTSSTGTVNFAAGEVTKTISIAILSDAEFEGNEQFSVSLSNPVNASIADSVASVTIREDDQPLSQTETQTLKDNLLVGKNSISRAEAQFMNRVMVRNRNTFFNGGQAQSTQPKLSFHNLAVDWNDKQEKLDALFSIDDLSSDKKRNISWETSISHSKNESGVKNTSVSTALNFSHRLSDNMMFGYILGFGYSDTTMTGTITGTNLGRSGSIGLYTSYKIQDSLIFDLMASKTFEKNELNSQIGNKFIEGEYDRNSSSLSSSLQGVYKFTNFEFRPTISYTIGKSLFNNAYFDITQSGLTSSQQIDFGSDEYFSLSFEPELKMLIGDKKQLLRPTGFNLMKIRPKYFCEKYNSEAVESCGEGLGITFANHHPKYFYNQDLTLDYEKISDTTTYAVRYKRTY